jgi:hypothetical protein
MGIVKTEDTNAALPVDEEHEEPITTIDFVRGTEVALNVLANPSCSEQLLSTNWIKRPGE